MKKIFSLAVLLVLLGTHPAFSAPQKASASMVASNSVGKGSPFEVFTPDATPWEPNPQDRFVKLHVYFDEPVQVAGVKIKPCRPEAPHSEITLYVNFDEFSGIISETDWHFNLPSVMTARSITLNFNLNTNICVSELEVFGPNLEKMTVEVPRIIAGQASATSTLAPESSYNIMNLFDSRFEFGWASNKKAKGDSLSFQFDSPQKIDKLRIWNGYQRSDVHCYSNSRAGKIKVEEEGGYQESVAVQDVMGSQVVNLSKPFEGKNLKLTIEDSFAGKKYPDLVISELRFGNGNSWSMLNPIPFFDRSAAENVSLFQKGNVAGVLGKSLRGNLFQEKGPASKDEYWTFRFRADGSFYIDGGASGAKGMGSGFYAIGNYEVKEATPSGVSLRIFGFLKKKRFPWGDDCNGCGRDCNKAEGKDESNKIFQDFVLISKTADGITIKNTGEVKNLPFSPLTLKEQDYVDYGD